MTSRKLLAAGLSTIVLVAACGGSTATPTPAPTAAPTTAPTTAPASQPASEAPASVAPASPTPLAPDPAEAVIPNVEANAEITFWTFYLSPTFDQYIKDTITRFEATYPTVKVKGGPPGDLQGRPEQRLQRGQRARRDQPLGLRGLGERVRGQGPPPAAGRQGPAGREGHLLPRAVEGTAHRRRQLPVPVVPGPQRRPAQQGACSTRPRSTSPASRRPSTASPPCATRSPRRATCARSA